MGLVHSIFILLALFGLTACGGQKSSTTLKVTSGMSLSNSSYKGGLAFYGRSSSGKFFSVPVEYSPTSTSNQIDILLDKDTWTFGVVGWNHPSLLPFEGTISNPVKCAIAKDVSINKNSETVTLTLTNDACDDSDFGNNTVYSGGVYNFKSLQIVTCGTFKDADGTTDLPLTTSLCTGSIAPDLKIVAKSARIFIPKMIPGQSYSPKSDIDVCVDLINGGNYYGYASGLPQLLPLKGLPVGIELFDEQCSDTNKKILSAQVFKDGLSLPYSQFDHKYADGPNYTELYLLATPSKKTTSPFLSSLPQFLCDESDPTMACLALPKTAISPQVADRHIVLDREFYFKDIASGESCSSVNLTSGVKFGPTTPSAVNVSSGGFKCEERDDKFIVTISNLVLSNFLTGTLSINFGAGDVSKIITVSTDQSIFAHEYFLSLLGFKDIQLSNSLSGAYENGFKSLQFSYNGDSSEMGVLSHVRDIFSVHLVGGFLSLFSSTQLNNITFNVQLMDEGTLKTFQIHSGTSDEAMPVYIRKISDPNDDSSDDYFDREITVNQLNGTPYSPFQLKVLFKQNKKIGMFRHHENKPTDEGTKRVSDTLIYWNTENGSHKHRVELYQRELETYPNTSPAKVKRFGASFTRAERDGTSSISTGQGLGVVSESLSFHSDHFCSSGTGANCTGHYNQRSSKTLGILNGNKGIFKTKSAELNNQSTFDSFFSDSATIGFRNSYGHTNEGVEAKSEDGLNRVWVWNKKNGSYYDLHIAARIQNSTQSFVHVSTRTIGSSVPMRPKASISNNGEIVIAYVATDPSTSVHSLNAIFSSDGTNWSTLSSAPTTSIAPFPFAIFDEDPTTPGSSKRLIYIDNSSFSGSGTLSVKSRTLTGICTPTCSYSWGSSASTLYTTQSLYETPDDLQVMKHFAVSGAGSYPYFLAYPYRNSSTPVTSKAIDLVKLTGLTGSPSAATCGSAGSYGASLIPNFEKLHLFQNESNTFLLVKTNTDLRLLTTSATSPSISGLGATQSNMKLDDPAPFIFTRNLQSPTSGSVLTMSNVSAALVGPNEDNMFLPSTSLAPPIRAEYFGLKVDDLAPNYFLNVFSDN